MKPLTRFLSFASVSDGTSGTGGHGSDDDGDCEGSSRVDSSSTNVMDVSGGGGVGDRRTRVRVLRARVDRARSSEEQRGHKSKKERQQISATASPVRCAPSGSMGNLSEVNIAL